MNDAAPASTWPEAYETLLRRAVPELAGIATIAPDYSLLDAGLDSLTAVGLINDIEEEFGVLFDEDLSDPALLTTPGYLWSITHKLVGRHLESEAPS